MNRQKPSLQPADLQEAMASQPDGPNVAPSAHEHEAAQGNVEASQSELLASQSEGQAAGNAPGEEDRQARIRHAAYGLAAERGFEPGHEDEDWLEAERQINAAGTAGAAD